MYVCDLGVLAMKSAFSKVDTDSGEEDDAARTKAAEEEESSERTDEQSVSISEATHEAGYD
jgi:hypothetical protein